MRNWLILLVFVLVAAVAALTRGGSSDVSASHAAQAAVPRPSAAPPARAVARGREDFVGSATCATCHRAESEAYLGSHHAQALVKPSAEVAKARFEGAHFTSKLGGTTSFSVHDGAGQVTTPLPGGKSATLPIAYVSGVWPLEQYVVATERGKLQSLGVVWDSRSKSEGGRKWFHVYGRDGVAPSDDLFFTSAAQSWNQICADCHSTRVERRYDVKTDSFETRWAELSVGCEACHGPGAEHVRSARAGGPVAALALPRSTSEPWRPSATGSPTPRAQDGVEVEACAPCHSRRTPLKEGFVASDPFLDSFEPDLLRRGVYHADGQLDGEDYEWGSFLQSKMYRSGVRCSDCHSAHSGKLLAQGNALCVRCHEPSRFDVPAHSHHTGARAPRCIDCHMPPSTFMQVDERRDHSIRIPRPDHSAAYGTPNACNGCHAEQSATWAKAAIGKWFPKSHERPHFVDALGLERQGSLDAPRALRQLCADAAAPAIARATALERLGSYASEAALRALRTALTSSDALVAYGAVRGAGQLPPPQRASLLVPSLEHPRRAVRVAAAKALAGLPLAELPPSSRASLERAFGEVEQSFEVSASRPEAQVERSAFELARGRLEVASASLDTALRQQPCLIEAHLNRADLERQRGDEAAAERAIRAALACNPQSAAAHHALGLWQVRARQRRAAIASLQKAVELAPADPRFGFVLAAALAGAGQREQAIAVLESTLEHRPNDASALQALAGYLRESGGAARADALKERLERLRRE